MPPDAHRAPERTAGLRGEARAIGRLAYPVAIAQVGMLTMGLVDTWMVGRLGAVELAAVALADAVFFTFTVLCMGIVQSLDPLVSQAHGAGDPDRCAAAWVAGRRLAIALTLPLALVVLGLGAVLERWGQMDAAVVAHAQAYLAPRTLGILPGLLYVADRCLLNGLGSTRPAMVVTLLANVVNAVLDWALIFGAWGAPALGVAGSGLATSLSRWFMFAALAWWVARASGAPRPRPGLRTLEIARQAVRLGVPIGCTHAAEVGAFAACSVLMGWLGPVPLASHQIAIKLTATAFMIAVALGVATSIRVGHAVGAGAPDAAARSGWTGFGLGLLFTTASGLVFFFCGRPIAATFTTDPEVVDLAASLLAVAAAFQLSDGTQAIAAGALRGAGDTTWPLFANLGAHWLIGLPVGATLAFGLGYGARAVWWALAVGLTLTAVALVLRFRSVIHRVRPLHEAPDPPAPPADPAAPPAVASRPGPAGAGGR